MFRPAAQRVRGLDAPRRGRRLPQGRGADRRDGRHLPGARVVEAGAGSGALTCSLLRAVGPTGRVSSFERREEFAEIARRNVDQFFGAPRDGPPGLDAHRRRPGRVAAVRRGREASTASCSTCSRRGSASTSWPTRCAPGGIVCAYVATTTQLGRVVETLRAHGEFTEPQPWETLVRDWHVEGLAVRPGPQDERSHRLPGHRAPDGTRPAAAGEEAPSGPGAYGSDYDGPRPAGLPPRNPSRRRRRACCRSR